MNMKQDWSNTLSKSMNDLILLYMPGTGAVALCSECLENLKEHTFHNKQSACIRYERWKYNLIVRCLNQNVQISTKS